jgi:glycosyltransferase involved in cell wall biosynthesis
MKKLSIILPVAGNNDRRALYLEECLKCVRNQSFKDYEVIVVEQSLDGKFYQENIKCDKYQKIKDPKKRGFNLSWCRNVGAKISEGQFIVLMDADVVFDSNYFNSIVQNVKMPFSAGSNGYVWTNPNQTAIYFKTNNVQKVLETTDRRMVPGERPVGGYGTILVFLRKWYFNTFGGYLEDFSKWSWEDLCGAHRALSLMGIGRGDIPKIPYSIVHLFHGNRDKSNEGRNSILRKYSLSFPPQEITERLKKVGIGDPKSPKSIFKEKEWNK